MTDGHKTSLCWAAMILSCGIFYACVFGISIKMPDKYQITHRSDAYQPVRIEKLEKKY